MTPQALHGSDPHGAMVLRALPVLLDPSWDFTGPYLHRGAVWSWEVWEEGVQQPCPRGWTPVSNLQRGLNPRARG